VRLLSTRTGSTVTGPQHEPEDGPDTDPDPPDPTRPPPIKRGPGPRDWEPTDPTSKYWIPGHGDRLGPSDQEYRQPWERPAPPERYSGLRDPGPDVPSVVRPPATVPPTVAPPVRRPPVAVAPPSKQRTAIGRALARTGIVLAVAVVLSIIESAVVPPRGLVFARAVLIGATIGLELLIGGALVALWREWPRARGVGFRLGFTVLTLLVLVPAPVDFVLSLHSKDRVLLITAAGVLGLAATIRMVAASWPTPSSGATVSVGAATSEETTAAGPTAASGGLTASGAALTDSEPATSSPGAPVGSTAVGRALADVARLAFVLVVLGCVAAGLFRPHGPILRGTLLGAGTVFLELLVGGVLVALWKVWPARRRGGFVLLVVLTSSVAVLDLGLLWSGDDRCPSRGHRHPRTRCGPPPHRGPNGRRQQADRHQATGRCDGHVLRRPRPGNARTWTR
jgi:hypothetical protein